jgi:mannose-6-phosphate isomerase-like protein (cupin superfamily)
VVRSSKNGKIWGETSLLFARNNVEVHRIKALAGGSSSKHRHAHKHNGFFVESGRLKVEVWKGYGIVDKTTLGPGESTDIGPGEYHRFTAIEDAVAFEIYWVQLDPCDIERDGVGSRKRGRR